jgi:hypothetical protein
LASFQAWAEMSFLHFMASLLLAQSLREDLFSVTEEPSISLSNTLLQVRRLKFIKLE